MFEFKKKFKLKINYLINKTDDYLINIKDMYLDQSEILKAVNNKSIIYEMKTNNTFQIKERGIFEIINLAKGISLLINESEKFKFSLSYFIFKEEIVPSKKCFHTFEEKYYSENNLHDSKNNIFINYDEYSNLILVVNRYQEQLRIIKISDSFDSVLSDKTLPLNKINGVTVFEFHPYGEHNYAIAVCKKNSNNSEWVFYQMVTDNTANYEEKGDCPLKDNQHPYYIYVSNVKNILNLIYRKKEGFYMDSFVLEPLESKNILEKINEGENLILKCDPTFHPVFKEIQISSQTHLFYCYEDKIGSILLNYTGNKKGKVKIIEEIAKDRKKFEGPIVLFYNIYYIFQNFCTIPTLISYDFTQNKEKLNINKRFIVSIETMESSKQLKENSPNKQKKKSEFYMDLIKEIINAVIAILFKPMQNIKIDVCETTWVESRNLINSMEKSYLSEAGKWLLKIISTVPIQIARIENGKLNPLLDGVSPKIKKDVDEISNLKNIGFGIYEYIFKYVKYPIFVISVMGLQKMGKSYLMNHMGGTSFDVASSRTTDGIWMSVCVSLEKIYVLLDFEGLGTYVRNKLEDKFFGIVSTSLADLMIFLIPTLIDEETMVMFERFYEGKTLLSEEDQNLFQGTLVFTVRGAGTGGGTIEEVLNDFMLKNKKKQINELFKDIGFDGVATLSRAYFANLTNILKNHLFKKNYLGKFSDGDEFYGFLKAILGKFKFIGGHSSLQQTLNECKMNEIKSYLNHVLYAGCSDCKIVIENSTYNVFNRVGYRNFKDKKEVDFKDQDKFLIEVNDLQFYFVAKDEDLLSPLFDENLMKLYFGNQLELFYSEKFRSLFSIFFDQIDHKDQFQKMPIRSFNGAWKKFIEKILSRRKDHYQKIYSFSFMPSPDLQNELEKLKKQYNQLNEEKNNICGKMNSLKAQKRASIDIYDAIIDCSELYKKVQMNYNALNSDFNETENIKALLPAKFSDDIEKIIKLLKIQCEKVVLFAEIRTKIEKKLPSLFPNEVYNINLENLKSFWKDLQKIREIFEEKKNSIKTDAIFIKYRNDLTNIDQEMIQINKFISETRICCEKIIKNSNELNKQLIDQIVDYNRKNFWNLNYLEDPYNYLAHINDIKNLIDLEKEYQSIKFQDNKKFELFLIFEKALSLFDEYIDFFQTKSSADELEELELLNLDLENLNEKETKTCEENNKIKEINLLVKQLDNRISNFDAR